MKTTGLMLAALCATVALAGQDALKTENGPDWAQIGAARSSFKDARVTKTDADVTTCILERKGLLYKNLSASSVELLFESDKLIGIDITVPDHAIADKTLTALFGKIDTLPPPMSGKMWEGEKAMISLQKAANNAGSVSVISAAYYMKQMQAAMDAAGKTLLESLK